MAISSDYPRPVQVNGYQCHNCAEVSQAKKFIDPAHAKSGPFGDDAAKDPGASPAAKVKAAQKTGDAVQFAGALSYRNKAVGSVETTMAPAEISAGAGVLFDKVA